MILHALRSRLRAESRKPAPRATPSWLGNSASRRFVLKVRWSTPTAEGMQESWKASFSCQHRKVVVEKHKRPKPRLKLVS